MPEMSHQIQHGLQNMSLDYRASVSTLATDYQSEISTDYNNFSKELDMPSFSALPKLINPPPNIPPSDEEFEATLWDARKLVLDSTDAEMQLAWAADALIYVGVCADNEERLAAAKPSTARAATPNIEHTLKQDAINIVSFLANQGHPKAEFLKGSWLEWGRYGQREDKKEAFRCYSRAVDKGYVRAEYRIGMLYESANDAIKALRHYTRGADAGDTASCYRLGMMTLRGQHGQAQDWQRGVDLIRQSAETADENAAQGAYVYGMLLARELPQLDVPPAILPPDEAKAKLFIEKAAFLKFAKAQLKMGASYELGTMCCHFDPALSMHYYALAAKQGESEADMALSKWFLVGHEGLFAKNEGLAFTYAERAAATGLATAEFALGYFNEIGMTVPVDMNKALDWYQKAAQHGNEDARGRVESLSKRQYLSKKDHEAVAIQRIKSVHNSGRPVQRQHDPMPRLSENPTYTQQSPPRAVSVAPYPLADGPPTHLAPRSSSVAPYPVAQSPASAYYHAPEGMPSWQRQQLPLPQRPATTTDFRDTRPAYDSRPSGRNQGPVPQRHDPRYNPPPPNQGLQPQPYTQRVASSPAYMQQQNSGYAPSPRPQQTPRPMNGQFQPGNAGPPLPPKAADFGFSAPYSPRHDTRMNGYPPRQQQLSQQQQYPQQRLPQSTSAPNMHQGGRMPSYQQNQQPPQQQMQARPPLKDPTPGPAPKPKPAKPAGPKTFEEMGVQAKKRDDCVMM